MSIRDEVIKKLQSKKRTVSHPTSWHSQQEFHDPSSKFRDALTAAGGEVFHTNTLEEALKELGGILENLGTHTVVANSEPPLNSVNLEERFPTIEWHIVGKSTGNLLNFCKSADVGLSGADAALADTGTIVLSSGTGKSRIATLLPPIHISIFPTSLLTTNIFSWITNLKQAFSPSITLVSGPSKTADIEQTLATGIHGPKKLITILYNYGSGTIPDSHL
jgi:L-lactate utilization protein LutC